MHVAPYSMCGCVHMLGNLPSQAGMAWCAGIGKSHMAGLVVAQLLLSGRVVLLELASPNSPAGSGTLRSFSRMQLKAGESSSWPPTRLPSWRCTISLAAYGIPTASFSCADGEASVHRVDTHLHADRWLWYKHRAVNYDKAKAPAYVVDGGVPSECSQCSTLVWLGPTPKPVTV